VWNPEDQLKYPTLGFNLKTKAAKLEMPINPTTISENPFEQFNFIIGTLDGNLYRCIFDKPGTKNEALFQQSSGVVWRNSVKLLMSNMSYDDLIKMKTYIEKFCKDKNIIDLNAEEFYKLKPDLTKFYKNSLKSNFEKHISCVTTVSYNGFIKGLFVTTSYDGSIRIYNNV
jgi:WD40 repeat protein